jgi:hypothetical protein
MTEDGQEPTAEQVHGFAADLRAAQLAVDVPREYSIVSALKAASDLFDQMRDLKLHILECPELTFVTSDNPVLLPYQPSPGRPMSVSDCGLCMAVDPRRMLFVVPHPPNEIAAMDCADLRRMFYLTTREAARRFMFSHPDLPDLKVHS